MNRVVIDIETKKTFDEVGGQHNLTQLGISFVGLYSYSQDKYFSFFEKDLPVLEKILLMEKPEIIGYNTVYFDNPILQTAFKELKISELPQLDIFQHVTDALGFRLKLDTLAQATLGRGKIGDGLDAIKYFRNHQYEELAKYCLEDVRITKEIYEYGGKHEKLLYTGGGELREVSVFWGDFKKINNNLEKALKDHIQLKVDYLELDEEGKGEAKNIILDPQEIKNNVLEGFSKELQKVIKINVNRILNLEETGENFAHQGAFFDV